MVKLDVVRRRMILQKFHARVGRHVAATASNTAKEK
jgi:hypothetical protein